MNNITTNQQKVLDFLKNKNWTSPTKIGLEAGGKDYVSASGWACNILKKLVLYKLVKKRKGTYKLK